MKATQLKRQMAAQIIHIGCNSLDSIRVMTFHEVIRKYPEIFTDEEVSAMRRRSAIIARVTKDLRTIAHRLGA